VLELILMTEEGPKRIQLDDDKLNSISQKIGNNRNTEAQNPVNKETQPVTPEPPTVVTVKSLRTFQGDAADIIKKQNTSVLSIALAEKKKQQKVVKAKPVKEANPELKKKILTISVSILLIILGIGTVAVFYYLQKNAPELITEIPGHEKTIISYNQKVSFDVTGVTRDKFLEFFSLKKRDTQLKTGETAYIALTKKFEDTETILSTEELFLILKTKAPSSVIRAFSNTFMMGLYKTDQNESFILIKLSSFENAFDGMLRWESTLNEDLGALFTRKILAVTENQLVSSGTSRATSTPIKVTQVLNLENPSKEGFTDETIKNKDARILKNVGGETIILYSFLDQNTLLIAGSMDVLQVMIDKINSLQQSR